MLIAATRTPGAAGENLTMMTQLAFCANVAGQPFVSEKSPGLAPVRVIPVTLKLVLPVFVIVVDCAVLVVPTP